MKTPQLIFSGILVTLIAGCAVPKAPSLPDKPSIPEHFSIEQNISKAVTALQNTSNRYWWEEFNDPLLNGLVQLALLQNKRIASGLAQLERAQADLKTARAGESLVSSIGLGSMTTERSNGNGQNETTQNFLSLEFELPVDTNGKVSAQVEAAASSVRVAQANLHSAIMDVSTEVSQEYLQFRGNQKQLDLLIKSIALQDKTLNIVQVRYETGLSPELDVRRAETSVQNLKASRPALVQSLTESSNRLATLTGQKPSEMKALLQTDRPLPNYESPLPFAIPAAVIQMRLDVQAALANALKAIAQVEVERADYYPSLKLQGDIQAGISSGSTITSFAIGTLNGLFTQLLTDGQARQGRLESKIAQAIQEIKNYELAIQLAIEETENQLAAIANSKERLVALSQAALSSQRSFAQADTLYQLGLVSFLDVVDAQRVQANAEQALAAEQTRQATLIAGLFRVLGIKSSQSELADAETSQ